jgi:hypothetical protein
MTVDPVTDDTAAPEPLAVASDTTGHLGGDCVCGDGWRFEATELSTGVVKAVLHPLSVEWEDNYTAPGVGSMLIATKGYAANDVWPNTTGVYVSRVNPDGTRVPYWGGFVEKVSGSAGGATTLGLKSIDSYLNRRLLATDVDVLPYERDTLQTRMGADLVNIARLNKGVPLFGVEGVGTKVQYRAWNAGSGATEIEFKNIGDAIAELVADVRGVRYHLDHVFAAGAWRTNMIFTDAWGETRNYVLTSDREGWQYSLEIDGSQETSRAYGVGAQGMYSIAYDEDALLPELQSTPSFTDTNVPVQLDMQTQGYITDHRDPATNPVLTVPGLNWPDSPPPDQLLPGDVVGVNIGYGLITFQGTARVLSIGWKLTTGQPVARTLALLPTVRPSQGIKTQTPAVEPAPTTPVEEAIVAPSSPWPGAGLLTTVKVSTLGEMSGIQGSRTYPNGVWVHNDENESPQVYLIDKTTGQKVGSWTPTGSSRVDPEAIRLNLQTNVLVLADIGDNNGNRTGGVRLFAVPEPTKGDKGTIPATEYVVKYPFGPTNAECLMIHPLTSEWLIATKDGRLVSFGTNPVPAPMGTLKATGLPANISDGDITRDGKFALFTTVGQSYVNVVSTSTWKKVGQIPIPAMAKCEAISILGPCHFVVTSEGVGAPIYQVLIPTAYGATCSTPAGPSIPPGNPLPAQVLNLTNWKLTLPI